MCLRKTTMSKYVVHCRQTRHTLMTYILGAKCVDGVVLIADRKITYPAGQVEYQDKLSRYYYQTIHDIHFSVTMMY